MFAVHGWQRSNEVAHVVPPSLNGRSPYCFGRPIPTSYCRTGVCGFSIITVVPIVIIAIVIIRMIIVVMAIVRMIIVPMVIIRMIVVAIAIVVDFSDLGVRERRLKGGRRKCERGRR